MFEPELFSFSRDKIQVPIQHTDSEVQTIEAMWDFYNDKTIFLTGGTGLVGTAILHRLFTKATPRRVFLLLRGGAGYVT